MKEIGAVSSRQNFLISMDLPILCSVSVNCRPKFTGYLPTPLCRVFLEKPTVFDLIKNPPFFVEFEGAIPLSYEPAIRTYPKPYLSIYLRYIL
jgi:hypothetical protein